MSVDVNTYSLLTFDKGITYDECNNLSWSTRGNMPTLSSSIKKFGKSSLYLNGGALTTSLAYFYDKPFSIDFYVYFPTSSHGYASVISTGGNMGFSPYSIRGDSSPSTSVLAYISWDGYGWDVLGDSISELRVNTWLHIYVGGDGNKLYIAEDGKIRQSFNYPGHIAGFKNASFNIGVGETDGVVYIPCYIDNFRISDICRWTSDFTPPEPVNIHTLFKDSTSGVYGFDDGQFVQVINDWNLLSDTEKVSMFETYGTGTPTSADFATIDNPFNILAYSENNSLLSAILTAIPLPKILTPNMLLDISNYTSISDITITATQNGNGVIKVAVTKDLMNYYVYDNGSFTKILDITTEGNTISEMNSATTAWSTFLNEADGIAFMFYISQQSSEDVASIDKIEITGDVSGAWKSAQEYNDYTYEYPSNTKLKVKFITTGNYKVNYPS